MHSRWASHLTRIHLWLSNHAWRAGNSLWEHGKASSSLGTRWLVQLLNMRDLNLQSHIRMNELFEPNIFHKDLVSRSPLFPLPRIKRQPIIIRLKRNRRPLRKIKHIPRRSMHLFARLIRNDKRALDNNLHLVIRVRIHERRALLQAVETCRDGLLGVDLVAEEGLC